MRQINCMRLVAHQVCKLPPAWGYAHLQQERLITSFPVANDSGRRTRILREEHDAAALPKWEAREDRWGYALSLAKLFAHMRVSIAVCVPACCL
jgi:hypothetical protein